MNPSKNKLPPAHPKPTNPKELIAPYILKITRPTENPYRTKSNSRPKSINDKLRDRSPMINQNSSLSSVSIKSSVSSSSFQKEPNTTNSSQAFFYCYGCEGRNLEKKFRTPKCKDHYFCRSCMFDSKTHLSLDSCTACVNFFTYRIRKIPPGTVRCFLCPLVPDLKKCEIHEFCRACAEFVDNEESDYLSDIRNCEKCKCVKEKVDVLTLSVNFNSCCSICFEQEQIKGFLCNHNLCIRCLVKTGLEEMNGFFERYRKDKNELDKIFCLKCPKQGCGKEISVPSMMVIGNHMKFMRDQKYVKENQGFAHMTLENVAPWIGYFDGLASWKIFK